MTSSPKLVDDPPFDDDTLVVLYWNDVHDLPDRWFGFGIVGTTWIGPPGHRTCPSSPKRYPGSNKRTTKEAGQCYFTTDRSLLERADAIVVSGQHDNRLDLTELPEYRHPDQIYIFYSIESPFHQLKAREEYGGWLNAFNWTFTYRKDSEVPIPYGTVERVPRQDAAAAAENYARSVEAIKWKNSSTAAIISHCTFKLPRGRMISVLQDAGLKIDIFGRCGNRNNICPQQWSEDCRPMLSKQYRFYLAFENSLCQDYVTEKLYEALKESWVPIVFGAANYSQSAPPNSVIEVTFSNDNASSEGSFNLINHHGRKLTPAQLVKLIGILEKNDTLYSNYFNWKKNFEVVPRTDDGCILCQRLTRWKHSSTKPRKHIRDIRNWWEPPGVCSNAD